jgi:hypothetical protein
MLKLIVLGAAIVLLLGGSAAAQIIPRRIEVDKLTCAELLTTKEEARFRLLVYLNGYMNGLRGQKVWDEQKEGERIDRAEKECRTAPTKHVLDVFASVWAR